MNTLPTHHAVNGLHILLFSFCVNAFDTHKTGMITGPTFCTGNTILFQLKKVEPFKQSHQIPHRADDAPKAFNKKASHQYRYGKKTSQIQIRPIAPPGQSQILLMGRYHKSPLLQRQIPETEESIPI